VLMDIASALLITVIRSRFTTVLFIVAPEHPESAKNMPSWVFISPFKDVHITVALTNNLRSWIGSGYLRPFLVEGPGISSKAFLFFVYYLFSTVPSFQKCAQPNVCLNYDLFAYCDFFMWI
jgi:hypothetical protein